MDETIDMTFVQAGENDSPTTGNDGVVHEDITCFGCNGTGHYRDKYTADKQAQLLQLDGEGDIITSEPVGIEPAKGRYPPLSESPY